MRTPLIPLKDCRISEKFKEKISIGNGLLGVRRERSNGLTDGCKREGICTRGNLRNRVKEKEEKGIRSKEEMIFA